MPLTRRSSLRIAERWPFITGPKAHDWEAARSLTAAMTISIEQPMFLSPPLTPSITALFDQLRAGLSEDQRRDVDTVLAAVPAHCRDAIIVASITSVLAIERATGWPPRPGQLAYAVCGIARSAFLQHWHVPVFALHTFKLRLAHEQRAAMIWVRCDQNTACDRTLPEVEAIYAGGDAIRDFVASGGTLHDESDGVGDTLAHHAARATAAHDDALAVFLQCHGHIHARANRFGRTPLFELVTYAQSTAALHLVADAGCRWPAALAQLPDIYGDTPASMIAVRELEWAAALARLVSTEPVP